MKNIISSFLVFIYLGVDAVAAPKITIGAAVGGPNTPYVEVPVYYENDISNSAVVEFDIAFDSSKINLSTVSVLPSLNGHELDYEIIGVGNTVRIVIFPPTSNAPIPTGTIANLLFSLPTGAIPVSQPLTISVNGSFSDQSVVVSSFTLLNGIIVVSTDLTSDSDGDGITDIFEASNGLHPFDVADAALDFDADGLTNLAEFTLGTDIYNIDTDGDGIDDSTEVSVVGLDPEFSGDASDDIDGDGLSNLVEFQIGTDIVVSDGIPVTSSVLPAQILTNTVLLPGNIYTIESDLVIVEGARLTIAPGAELQFVYDPGYNIRHRLIANGDLNIQGLPNDPVELYTAPPYTGQRAGWKGISVKPSSSSSVINYASIRDTLYGVVVNGANIEIKNSFISNYHSTGIYMWNGAGGVITGNHLDNLDKSKDGIYLNNAAISDYSLSIQGNIIERNSRGIFMTGAINPTINAANVIRNNIYGIIVQGGSVYPQPVITGNSLYNNDYTSFRILGYSNPSTRIFDASNNWWGTTDANLIDAAILDYADFPSSSPIVNYLPILTVAP